MNIQHLTSDLNDTARNVAHRLGDAIEHGRDVLGETGKAGVSKASAAIDSGSSAIHSLTKLMGAYASMKTLKSAIDSAAPVTRGLGALGLARRPSTLSRVLMGVGLFAAGAAVGAGVALLLAPERGEQTRKKVLDRLQTLRGDAKGVAHDVTEAARLAAQNIESTASNVVNEVSSTAQNLVGSAGYGGSSWSGTEPTTTKRKTAASRAPRAPRAPRSR